MRAGLWAVVAVVLTACASHKTSVRSAVPPTPTDAANYIDLQPGWRLRVITPLTKSGSYLVSPKGEQKTTAAAGGLAMTLSADRDFIGYETAYYSIESRVRGGVRIGFLSAEDTKRGVKIPQSHPRTILFRLSGRARYVRLVYLARVSRADHDMALLAATHRHLLDPFTHEVQTDPKRCIDSEQTFCYWIPAGIAIQPEVATKLKDSIIWKPAR